MQQELPLGFGMALSQNQNAMQYFASLEPEKKEQIIKSTHQINSRKEMHAFVQKLGDDHAF